MPTILRFLFPASALLALVPAIAAEPDAQDGPTKLPLWEAGVGAAAFSTPAYPGASDRSNRWLVVPFLLYRGKVLRADQEGVGARLLDTDKIEFDVGFAGALPAHSNDVEVRRGMPDLGTLVEFGPRVKYKFADFGAAGRMRFDLPVRAVMSVFTRTVLARCCVWLPSSLRGWSKPSGWNNYGLWSTALTFTWPTLPPAERRARTRCSQPPR